MQMTDLDPFLIYTDKCVERIKEKNKDCSECVNLVEHIRTYQDMIYTLLDNKNPICEAN